MSSFTWISSRRLECFQSKSTSLTISTKPKMLCLQAKNAEITFQSLTKAPRALTVCSRKQGLQTAPGAKTTSVDGHGCLVQITFMTCYTNALLWMGLTYYSWLCWSLTLETVLAEFFMRVLVRTSTTPDRLCWPRVRSPGHLLMTSRWRTWRTSAVISRHPWH